MSGQHPESGNEIVINALDYPIRRPSLAEQAKSLEGFKAIIDLLIKIEPELTFTPIPSDEIEE